MLKAKELASALSKIMKNSEVGKNARIQVRLPQGEYRSVDGFFDVVQDITKLQNARSKKINKIAKENGTQHLVDEVTELGIIGDEIDIAGMTIVDKKLKYYMTN